MNESTSRQIVLAARPQGRPKLTDFRLEQTAIPTPRAGQIVLRVQYLSLDRLHARRPNGRPRVVPTADPARRCHAGRVRCHGGRLAPPRLLGRRHRAGSYWVAHFIRGVGPCRPAQARPGRRPGHATGLGVLGMPGFTAYGGLRRDRQTPTQRNGRCRGGQRAGGVPGRPTRQACRGPGGWHRGRPRVVRVRQGRTRLRRGN